MTEKIMNSRQARSFINFVENACLMHDLGNPPFGHFGEAAIARWFKDKGLVHARTSAGLDSHHHEPELDAKIKDALADFIEFDGNCQGLRIVSLLQWNDDSHGLNLTYTSLASYLKYIRAASVDSSAKKILPFRKKAGFFSTERFLVEAIWEKLGYSIVSPQRFPLAYVMEAADDIAYCISDLEDSIEKTILKPQWIFKTLNDKWKELILSKPNLEDQDLEKISEILSKANFSSRSDSTTFTVFRTSLSSLLTEVATRTYCDQHTSVLEGTCLSLIEENSSAGQVLEMLKRFCRENVYGHISVQRIELSGLTAIEGLLNHFGVLLNCSFERFLAATQHKTKFLTPHDILIESKLLRLFPEKYLAAYKHALEKLISDDTVSTDDKTVIEWNLRAHLVVDFISGMTDDFAINSFQILSGIKAE